MTGAARSPRQTPRFFSPRSPADAQLRAALMALLLPLLLSACQQHSGRHPLLSEVPGPHTHLAPSTLAKVCDNIWQDDDDRVNKPDYWLSLMECASRMTPAQAQARAEAWRHQGESWQDSFRQSILLDAADSNVASRRQAYHRLLGYRDTFPTGIYPLFTLWRQQQALRLRLVLADERSRTQRQQQESDRQIRTLTAREQQLNQQLATTTRKLQNLTDIERRLSSRKWQTSEDDGTTPLDGGHGKAAAEKRQTREDDGTTPLDGGHGKAAADKRQTREDDGTTLLDGGHGKAAAEQRQTQGAVGSSAGDDAANARPAAVLPPAAAPDAEETRQ